MTQLVPQRRPRTRAKAGGALILALGLVLAGCSGTESSPQQASSQQTSSTPTASTATASTPSSPPSASAPSKPPTVAAPVLAKYTREQLIRKPCLSLDSRDLVALGIARRGKQSPGKSGVSCAWQVGKQYVSLDLNVSLSYAQTMTKNGRVTQVPVGTHSAVQSEFQHICFIFVALTDTAHLVGATAIPNRGAPQEGACPAGAAVTAAALTHIR